MANQISFWTYLKRLGRNSLIVTVGGAGVGLCVGGPFGAAAGAVVGAAMSSVMCLVHLMYFATGEVTEEDILVDRILHLNELREWIRGSDSKKKPTISPVKAVEKTRFTGVDFEQDEALRTLFHSINSRAGFVQAYKNKYSFSNGLSITGKRLMQTDVHWPGILDPDDGEPHPFIYYLYKSAAQSEEEELVTAITENFGGVVAGIPRTPNATQVNTEIKETNIEIKTESKSFSNYVNPKEKEIKKHENNSQAQNISQPSQRIQRKWPKLTINTKCPLEMKFNRSAYSHNFVNMIFDSTFWRKQTFGGIFPDGVCKIQDELPTIEPGESISEDTYQNMKRALEKYEQDKANKSYTLFKVSRQSNPITSALYQAIREADNLPTCLLSDAMKKVFTAHEQYLHPDYEKKLLENQNKPEDYSPS